MKNNRSAKIIGTGSYLPEKVLSNHDLEKMVDTSDEWITSRTGMKERRIADAQEFTSDMGTQAAVKALENSGLAPEQIDCVLVATSTPDYQMSSSACIIQHALGAESASAMDLQAACSGYLYGLFTAKSFIESGAYKNVLLVAAEKLSSVINYKDRTTCVLFGDGASACVVSSENKDGFVLKNFQLGSDGKHATLGVVPGGGCRSPASPETLEKNLHYIQMNGGEIFKHAVRRMEMVCKDCMDQAGLKESDISWLIPHQANIRIIEAMAKRFQIPMDQVYINLHKYGNTSSSSVGIALDELARGKALPENAHLLLTAFGFGLTWGAGILTYTKNHP